MASVVAENNVGRMNTPHFSYQFEQNKTKQNIQPNKSAMVNKVLIR